MSDPVREAFESWVRERMPGVSMHRYSEGKYMGLGVRRMWGAWQAALASPVSHPNPENVPPRIDDCTI